MVNVEAKIQYCNVNFNIVVIRQSLVHSLVSKKLW